MVELIAIDALVDGFRVARRELKQLLEMDGDCVPLAVAVIIIIDVMRHSGVSEQKLLDLIDLSKDIEIATMH